MLQWKSACLHLNQIEAITFRLKQWWLVFSVKNGEILLIRLYSSKLSFDFVWFKVDLIDEHYTLLWLIKIKKTERNLETLETINLADCSIMNPRLNNK